MASTESMTNAIETRVRARPWPCASAPANSGAAHSSIAGKYRHASIRRQGHFQYHGPFMKGAWIQRKIEGARVIRRRTINFVLIGCAAIDPQFAEEARGFKSLRGAQAIATFANGRARL